MVAYYCSFTGLGDYYWAFDGKGAINVLTTELAPTGVSGKYTISNESLQVEFANPPLNTTARG